MRGTTGAARAKARKRKHKPIIPSKPRDRRGTFGIPPPPRFDFDGLPDSVWLTSDEVAAVLRRSRATIPAWRQTADHALKWELVDNKPLYRVGNVRAFIASGRKRENTTSTDDQ